MASHPPPQLPKTRRDLIILISRRETRRDLYLETRRDLIHITRRDSFQKSRRDPPYII